MKLEKINRVAVEYKHYEFYVFYRHSLNSHCTISVIVLDKSCGKYLEIEDGSKLVQAYRKKIKQLAMEQVGSVIIEEIEL